MNKMIKRETKFHCHQLHKFGGSSLANIECYQRVINIITNYSKPGDLIVVSASGNTTNQLINWLKLSQTNHILAYQEYKSILSYQINLIIGLLSNKKRQIVKLAFLSDIDKLKTLIHKSINNDIYAEVVGHGEIWSARLMSAVLEEYNLPSHWLDARLFLRAEFAAQPKINEIISRPLLHKLLKRYPNKILVVTGFIAQNRQGKTILLGRNGSDYSATQVGVLAEVNKITIWSDVAGIYSADPSKVKNAYLLPLLRFDEAIELARLNTPILHARTLQPISVTNINIQLRCYYKPEYGSTKIAHILSLGTGVKIITSHDDICLIELTLTKKQNFNQTYKFINLFLKQTQLQPLVVNLNLNKKTIKLYYTSEVAVNAISILQNVTIIKNLSLYYHFSFIALIGAGIGKNPLNNYYFHKQLKNQPVEFIWHSEEKISIIAILRTTQTSHLVKILHKSLFKIEKILDSSYFI
ncbi:MAG: hypothetical protein ArsCj_1150 [Arsenophonus endosymbiont of Ceratovacuna japonica]